MVTTKKKPFFLYIYIQMKQEHRRRRIESSDEDELVAGIQEKKEVPTKRSACKPKKRILHKGRHRVMIDIEDEDENDSDSELLTLETLTVPRVPGCSVPELNNPDNAWWSRPEKICTKKQNPTTSFVVDEAEETDSYVSEENPNSESEVSIDQNAEHSHESNESGGEDDESSIGSFVVDDDDEENSDAWRSHLLEDDYFNGDCAICAAPCNEMSAWKCPYCRRIFCIIHNSPRFVCDCDK